MISHARGIDYSLDYVSDTEVHHTNLNDKTINHFLGWNLHGGVHTDHANDHLIPTKTINNS